MRAEHTHTHLHTHIRTHTISHFLSYEGNWANPRAPMRRRMLLPPCSPAVPSTRACELAPTACPRPGACKTPACEQVQAAYKASTPCEPPQTACRCQRNVVRVGPRAQKWAKLANEAHACPHTHIGLYEEGRTKVG
jgi:hypothetical protein